jgi:hypothetical protein
MIIYTPSYPDKMPPLQFNPLDPSLYELLKHRGGRYKCRGKNKGCKANFVKSSDINTYVIELEDKVYEWWCIDCVWKEWTFLTDEYIRDFIKDNIKIKMKWLNQ